MFKDYINKIISKEVLIDYINTLHAHDIAKEMMALSEEEQKEILELLAIEVQADVLSYFDSDDAADILATFDIADQKDIVEHLEPDDAADIIQELEKDDKDALLDVLDAEEKEDILELLEYLPKTAGAHMTNLFAVVQLGLSVKDATKKVIKEADNLESIDTIFVVDQDNKYAGQITLKKLIKAKVPLLVDDILAKEPTFNDTDSIDNLLSHLRHYGAYETPITDADGVLLGFIALDDILDIQEEENIDSIQKLSALPDTEEEDSIFKRSISRLPWLAGLLLLMLVIAVVVAVFEDILEEVVILAFFTTLILDSGGSVSTQTLAVTLIGLDNKGTNQLLNGTREFLSGLFSGLLMGLVAAVAVIIYAHIISAQYPLLLALTVGLSLWITVALSPLIGFIVPITLKKLKFDPAAASGPFITTIIDVLSLFLYFGIAMLILGGLLL